MAFALALSVSASVGVGLVAMARILYGMASHRVLPPVLSNVSHRFSTPAIGSIVVGLTLIAVTWVYLLSTSVANLFTELINVVGLLYAGFYVLTALAAIAYYRHRIVVMPGTRCSSASFPWALPGSWSGSWSRPCKPGLLRSAGRCSASSPRELLVMLAVRFVLRPPFFQTPRESAAKER